MVVMLHPDYQYDATRIPDLVAPILAGEADMAGQPLPRRPLAGGMPRWKYANRFLTTLQNRAYDLRLSEYQRLPRLPRKLLETIGYRANSDDFVFDQELVGQVVRWLPHRRDPRPHALLRRVASSVNFRRSVVYGLLHPHPGPPPLATPGRGRRTGSRYDPS